MRARVLGTLAGSRLRSTWSSGSPVLPTVEVAGVIFMADLHAVSSCISVCVGPRKCRRTISVDALMHAGHSMPSLSLGH
jgi:hypothetical protein